MQRTIAVADDQPGEIQKLISLLAHADAYSVSLIARNGYELLVQLHGIPTVPDIFIVDINMPVMDGIAVNFYLSCQFPQACIINLSGYCDEGTILQAIMSGADGYLVKQEVEPFVVPALEAVIKGDHYLDPRIEADKKNCFPGFP